MCARAAEKRHPSRSDGLLCMHETLVAMFLICSYDHVLFVMTYCLYYPCMYTVNIMQTISILYPYSAMHLVLILKQVSSTPQGCIYILKIMFSMIIRETVLRKLINTVQKFGVIYNKLSVSKDIYNITKGLNFK